MALSVINTYQTFKGSTGQPRASGWVTFFVNTTSVLAAIYSDDALTVAQTNPYQLDASGRIKGDVKYIGLMTLQETNEDGSDIITTDNVTTMNISLSVSTYMETLLDDTDPGAAMATLFVKGSAITSASTLVLGTDGNYLNVSGSTGPITDMTVSAGRIFALQFNNTPTLTHHATNLNLPGGNDIVVKAGESLIGFATADDQVFVLQYRRDALVLTTAGDILYRNSTGPVRLAKGTAGQVLAMNSGVTAPEWVAKSFPNDYIFRLILSNDTDTDHDINVSVGQCFNSDNTVVMDFTSTITKQIDATWAAGDDSGGMNDGETVGNDTWYHYFALSSADGTTVDYGFDTSITAVNLLADAAVIAAGLTKYRLLESVLTDGSANIIPFVMDDVRNIVFDVTVLDVNTTSPGTSAVTPTMTSPLGRKVLLKAGVSFYTATTSSLIFTDPAQTDTAPSSILYTLRSPAVSWASAVFSIRTNISSQIRYRWSSNPTVEFRVFTIGWRAAE